MYNPPSGNITSTADIFMWINSVTDSWFFPGLLIAVYFVIFIKLLYSSQDIGKAFTASSFVCMIMAVLLRVTNLINTTFMILFIVLTAIGTIWMQMENAKYG
jgi:hypothetical protein